MMNAMKLFTTLVLFKVNLTSAFLTPSKSTASISSCQHERTTYVPLAAQETYAEIEAAAEKAVELSVECSIDYKTLEQAVEYEAERMAEREAIATYRQPIPQSPKINVELAKIKEEQRKESERQQAMKLKEQQEAEKRKAQARAEAEAMRIVQEAQASIAKDVISHSENTEKKKKRFDIPRAAVSDPTEKEEKIENVKEVSKEEMGPETRRMYGLKSSGKLVRNVLEEIALPTGYYNEEFLLDDEMSDESSLL